MGSGGVPPKGDDPVRFEVLHESDRTRVTRVFTTERTVICKEPLGPDAPQRLRREVAMLERLRGVAGVAQLLTEPGYPGSIVEEDVGGGSLARLVKPVAIEDLVALGLELARAVAGMHQRGVMHRDITPANILLSPEGAPCLVDFALATSFAEIRPEFIHHTKIVGTLAYLAPEQTGRTGRSVDQRADLYALGATLYELATGEPPFGSGDPLQLTHDHLARVPVPPAEVNSAVPNLLSNIIMHLLEKEPGNRYQSADGMIYDLERLSDTATGSDEPGLRIGEHDVPLRLLPPSRVVGRDDDVAMLKAAFDDAVAGRCRGVLVTGPPGVGKTALVNELRSVVTGTDGWFVAGKFDPSRSDLEFDGVYQAYRALGRLLLAEPEDALTEVTPRILNALGPNAGLAAATSPEFAALLGVPPAAGDPLTAKTRSQRAGVNVFRAVASPKRPLVLFVDDLQWAGRAPLDFIDLLLSEDPSEGLLVVGAYREDDAGGEHLLLGPLSRWPEQTDVRHIRLANLAVPNLVTMVAEILRVDQGAAAGVVRVIHPHTSGNPYETVGLLNELRREGLLTAAVAGWQWDETAVCAHLGRSEMSSSPAGRMDAMPAQSRQLVEVMACLGGRVQLSVLQIAAAQPAHILEQALVAAVDEGLLVIEPGDDEAVRFRHDRIREAILDRLDPPRRAALQLSLARRLAELPDMFAVAAQQYLPVIGAVDDVAERRRAVGLLRRAADQARLVGDHWLVNALTVAALRLTDPGHTAMLVDLHTRCHASLYGMGRLDQADEEYLRIEQLCTTLIGRAEATCVQVRSLTTRNRLAEAIALGLQVLGGLGIAIPAAERLLTDLGNKVKELERWLDRTEGADDLTRPEMSDPSLLAATRLINAILPATYFAEDLATHAWLSVESLRIWLEHGPGPTLIGPASTGAFSAVALGGDYSRGYQAMRRILALGEARGYEPDTSQARYLFAAHSCWSEPIENSLRAAQRAREGLLAGGELTYAGYTYQTAASYLLDCASSLEVYLAEVEAGLAFVTRTGGEQTGQWLDSYRWLAGVLRGERFPSERLAVPTDSYAGNPLALLYAHTTRSVAAAILSDPVALAEHTAAAMPLLPIVSAGTYSVASVRLLHGLVLAEKARTSPRDERDVPLSELDDVIQWFAERAEKAPENFVHLLRLLEAERSWATDDFRAAALAFDIARREAAPRQRPWHKALIAERAARFFLAHGLEHTGYDLLAQARHDYLLWGATAKVAQFDWAYPTLRPPADGTDEGRADHFVRGSAVTTGTIDLLAILSASQALSSQNSIERLNARVVELVGAMTGATKVRLLLWNDERRNWLLPTAEGDPVPVTSIDHESAVPMSVLRCVQRLREPLIVGDATADARFARDPYFAHVDCCSLLALPILNRGSLQALLLLENCLIRGAFTSERLDAIKLIAGQLAVSVEQTLLYAEFRRIADEQAASRRVATLVAEGGSPTAVFDAVAAEIERLLDADGVTLGRYEVGDVVTVVAHRRGAHAQHMPPGTRISHAGENVTTMVRRTARPARIDYPHTARGVISDATRGGGTRVAIGAPIVVDGRLWGVISAAWSGEELPPAGIEDRMAQFAELLGTAIANADSRDQLTASRARLLEAGDEARRRVARDLHDGAQQRLVQSIMTLKVAQEMVSANDTTVASTIGDALKQVEQANSELRELAHGMLPGILTTGGLKAGVDVLVRRLDLPVHIDVPTERFTAGIEASAYFIVAEALTNVVKHAQATHIEVKLYASEGMLRVEVRDDGVGGADPSGHGLLGITDRATTLGGRMNIESPPGGGTLVAATLPLTHVPLTTSDPQSMKPDYP